MNEFLESLDNPNFKRKKHNNSMKFINFMEFAESDKPVPFFLIYWAYRKWCEENNIRPNRIVTKHILSRSIGLLFKKKSTYPKTKKYGVRVDYMMVVYVKSDYLNFSEEEQELAFNYYHMMYDKERASWKRKRSRKQKELVNDLKQNTLA
jgi:hypothetical protein